MSKFKLGDRVTITKVSHTTHCATKDDWVGLTGVIHKTGEGFTYEDVSGLAYKVFVEAEEDWFWFLESSLKLEEKTMDNLAVGDVLEKYSRAYTVLALLPGLVALSECDEPEVFGNWLTTKELVDNEYIIKGNETPKEMTVAEIAEALGHEVKVVK